MRLGCVQAVNGSWGEHECECVMCLENTTDTRHLSIRLVYYTYCNSLTTAQPGTGDIQAFMFSPTISIFKTASVTPRAGVIRQ